MFVEPRFSTRMIWHQLLQNLHHQFTTRWRLSASRCVEVLQLRLKWHRQEVHTSRLAPLITFPEHSALDAPTVLARPLHCRFQFLCPHPSLLLNEYSMNWVNIVPLYDWWPPSSFHITPSYARRHWSPLVQNGVNLYIAGACLYCGCFRLPVGSLLEYCAYIRRM